MSGIKALTLALALVGGSFAITSAQTQVGNGQELVPPPTNLVIEVYYFPREPPAYMTVAPSRTQPIGAWYSRFARVPGWTASADFPTLNAVDIRPILIDERVEITVSGLYGKLNDQQKPVGVYTLREGEKTRVEELAKFGVEPFGLALVRVAPSNPSLPQVISKAKSIELVTIAPNLSTLPSYRMALRNLSNQNVRAIMVRVLQGERLLTSGGRQGKEGSPLIPAGGVAEIISQAKVRANVTPGGYKPVPPENQTIEVSMALFEDGTFEGDIESAAIYSAGFKGSKFQLGRIIGLVQDASQDKQTAPAALLESLVQRIGSLDHEADPAVLQNLLREYPSLTNKAANLKEAIEIEMRLTGQDVQDEIRRYQRRNPNLDPNSVRAWLAAVKQKYEAWRARL